MGQIVILGAGVMGSAMSLPAAAKGHRIDLVGTHLDEEIVRSVQGNGLFSGSLSIANLTATGTATIGSTLTAAGSITATNSSGNLDITASNTGTGSTIGFRAGGNNQIRSSGNIVIADLSNGTLATFTSAGGLTLTGTAASTNSTSGAFQVLGGAGIGGKAYVGDTLTASNVVATSTTAVSSFQQLLANGSTTLGAFSTSPLIAARSIARV